MASTAVQPQVARSTPGSGIGRPLLLAFVTAAVLTINILSNALPFNGLDTGTISDSFEIYFVPAGYVFAIWGVIYVGWLAYVIYNFLPRRRDDAMLRRLAPWYIASGVANAAWLFAWHWQQFEISVAIILVLLVSLIQCYRIVNAAPPASRARFWMVNLLFSVYLAWACVATIANATATLSLYTMQPLGIGPVAWSAILIGVATLLGLLFSRARADVGFVAVFVWALVGIAVKFTDTPLVLWSAVVGAVLLVASLFYTVPNRRRRLAAAPAAPAPAPIAR